MSLNTPTVSPKITAEQALRRLLTLISASLSVENFTPERLEQVMGVPIKHWEGGYGYGFEEDITPQWIFRFMVSEDTALGKKERHPRFELNFIPSVLGASPPMTDICQFDYDHFTAELEAMGFDREPYYDALAPGPRQPLMYDSFYNPDKRMLIEVYPKGEGVRTQDQGSKPGRGCVKMIIIK
ncbi:MAG: hypothetical protein FWG56_00070 [Desulfovibrionaceae bacterium]|nr:hypothetical protein [Desulfovibrionaceae bacterium]